MSLKIISSKHFITYRIYLYYNLYLRHKAFIKRETYSQWGEDRCIGNFFINKKNGFYVDIGSFHPVMYSNTCVLFNRGWSGINIDLNQTSIDLYNIIRPNDHNICAALSDKVEEKDLFFDHNFSPLNTIDESTYQSSNKNIFFKNLSKKKIITKKFEDIVKDISNIPKIDFLNIDCEGFDLAVLNGFNLEKYTPELICIETHSVKNEENVTYKDIIDLLKKHSYKILKRFGPSSIFVKY